MAGGPSWLVEIVKIVVTVGGVIGAQAAMKPAAPPVITAPVVPAPVNQQPVPIPHLNPQPLPVDAARTAPALRQMAHQLGWVADQIEPKK